MSGQQGGPLTPLPGSAEYRLAEERWPGRMARWAARSATIASFAHQLVGLRREIYIPLATTSLAGAQSATDKQRADLLWSPPAVSLYRAAALNVSNNTLANPISWDQAEADTHSGWSGVTNPTRYTIPTGWGGYWFFAAGVKMVANATGAREVYLRIGGSSYRKSGVGFAHATQAAMPQAAGVIAGLNASDYLEVVPYQNSGGALATVPSLLEVYLTGFWLRAP